MAVKSANVMARVEPDIKERAENILSGLGIPVSVLINMVYRQIIVNNGIPFSLTLPSAPLGLDDLSREQFDAIMEKGMADAENGNGVGLHEAFRSLRSGIQ